MCVRVYIFQGSRNSVCVCALSYVITNETKKSVPILRLLPRTSPTTRRYDAAASACRVPREGRAGRKDASPAAAGDVEDSLVCITVSHTSAPRARSTIAILNSCSTRNGSLQHPPSRLPSRFLRWTPPRLHPGCFSLHVAISSGLYHAVPRRTMLYRG